MRLEWIGGLTGSPAMILDNPLALIFLALAPLFILFVFWLYRDEASSIRRHLPLFLAALAAAVTAPLVLRVSDASAPAASAPVPLLASVPLLLAALWLGRAPAALAGGISGLIYALSAGAPSLHPLLGALAGFVLAWCLRQSRRGPLFALFRLPIFTAPLVSVLLWPLPLYAYLVNPALWAGLLAPAVPPLGQVIPALAGALLFGGLAQLLLILFPTLRQNIRSAGEGMPQRTLAGSLRARLMPLLTIIALVSIIALYAASTRIAFEQTLDRMESSASDIISALEGTVQAGLESLDSVTAAGRFADLPIDQWTGALGAVELANAPFHTVILLDQTANIVAVRSLGEGAGTPPLNEAEAAAIADAIAQGHAVLSRTYRWADGQPAVALAAPLLNPRDRQVRGMLIGRMLPLRQPAVETALSMRQGSDTADRMYLIDDRGSVLFAVGAPPAVSTWVANSEPLRRFPVRAGQAYAENGAAGQPQLTYWRRIDRLGWHLVMETDQGTIMQSAGRLARPLLFLLTGLFAILAAGMVWQVQSQLHPLGQIAQAAARIAAGELNTPLPEADRRGDEIGELVRAIKRMTIGLGAGVEELARLVEVSQNVSARANLEHTVGILLRAVTRGMEAHTAGMYLIGTDGAIWKRFIEGEGNLPADLELYLEQMAGQTWRKARQVIVSDVREEHGDVPFALMERASVAAFVMLPMLREGRNLGALWALWPAPRPFSTSDVHFLSALASLGGIMIENNRIYHAVESERSRLAAILNSTPDTILVLDAEGRLQLANPAAEELLDFNFQERVGTPLPELISDDSLFRMLSDIARGRGPTTIELERDGRRLYVSASPIRLSGKTTPQGWVLVMRDITDWKRLDELQTDFVHTIAHDMKSPLTFVRGYASMLRDEAVSERQLEYIEKILKGIDDLTQLINELTELAEVSNKIGMTMTPVQLVTLVSEVAENMRTYAEGKGLSFLVELPADAPMVIGDPDRLKRAVRNLIDNAIKYTMAPGWVKVSVQEMASAVVVKVADSGIGISQADRRRIFEKFYRVRRRETLHIHGTGLGLALVKEVAEQHGGQVWVESEVGVGSIFYLAIPKDRRLADVLEETTFLRPTGTPAPAREPAPPASHPVNPPRPSSRPSR